jgi:hypothetical protein
VDVHAHDHVTAGVANHPVEAGGLQAVGVVDQADARVGCDQAVEDLAGAIGGPAVGDQDLDAVRRVVLRLHRGDAGLDVVLLVEGRHRDRDQGLHHAWILT